MFPRFKKKKKYNFVTIGRDLGKAIKKKNRFTWKRFGTYLLYAFVAFIFVVALMFAWFAKDLPTPGKIASRKPVESTKIFDRTGQTLLYETGEQRRTVVSGDQVSQYLKDATIATEDSNFYKHHGFDTRAIIRAVYNRITHKTSRVSATSTITQQYVKNALLSSDRSITRKIKELILSMELEFMYSKDEILTMYLNEIPYGNSNAGAEAASQMYFGVSAKDLTLSQAATLAAIPQAPTYYSPYGTHTDKLIARKDYVLERMVDLNKISREKADEAQNQDVLAADTLKPRRDSMIAPHFAMFVMEQIAEEYGEDVVQKEGLKVITTLDMDKQKIAEEAISANVSRLSKYNASNAALVSVDPKTGQILAMVGSKDYFDTTIDGNVNVADSLRQPGSSFKPIVYATAFKRSDFSPARTLYDVQTDFGNGYVPRNYNGKFNGAVTARYALGNSLNIPAVKTTSLAGIDNIIRTAEDMGITSLNKRSDYGLSFGLGVAEVKPIEMAGAFSVFANGGVKHAVKPFIKITDSQRKVMYEYDQEKDTGDKVLDPQIAYQIASIMSDNNTRSMTFGSRSALYFANRTVAAKTGTTSDNKDGWTIGYTPSLATAVWVGNNTPSPMKTDAVVLAGPIFHAYMENSLANTPDEPFARPEGIQDVTVERYSGKLPQNAGADLITDIFASWQVPTEKDTTNLTVKVCKGTNKLAPDGLPDSAAELRTYINIHSERPENPSWENPVIAWLQSAGIITGTPPTEYCNIAELSSSISISAPVNGATLSSTETIIAVPVSNVAITNVEFFIDNVSIGSVNAAPYQKSYNFGTLTDGAHKVSVIATNELGATANAEVSVTIAKIAALSVSNVTATYSGGQIHITWTTNKPATTQIAIKKSTDASFTTSSIDSTLTTTHSADVSALSGLTYIYKVMSMDADGGTANSGEKSIST